MNFISGDKTIFAFDDNNIKPSTMLGCSVVKIWATTPPKDSPKYKKNCVILFLQLVIINNDNENKNIWKKRNKSRVRNRGSFNDETKIAVVWYQ